MKKLFVFIGVLIILILIIAGHNFKKDNIDNKVSLPPIINNEEQAVKNINGLVRAADIDSNIFIDLKYASKDNFTGQVVYPFKTCLLRKETAEKLSRANKQLSSNNFKIKIYDGYRPPFAQRIFWDLVKDERYVANPEKRGSIHSRGGAVDVTMVDSFGNEAEMPSKFDDFTGKGSRSTSMSDTARKNLNILTAAMVDNGFISLETEWWHFSDKDLDKYETVDVDPRLFEK